MGVTTTCEIGTTYGGMVTLASLGIPGPVTSYRPSSDRVRTASGLLHERGWATAEWRFPLLTQAQIEALRDIVGNNASAAVFIKTPINEDRAPTVFECVVDWPEDETGTAFRLSFVALVEYST